MTAVVEVSVILGVRNGAATIRRQLAALDAQTEHPPFEVVVVDNGSRDGTSEVVRRWIAEGAHAASRLELVDGGARPGIPRTRNNGARHASGRVLAFCDADDAVLPGWVGAFARAVDADQLAGGRIIACEADGSPRPGTFGPGLVATPYLPHVSGASFAVPRAVYLEVGGFDESLPAYGFDDVDFSWRVQEAGHPIVFAPDAAVRFTLSTSAASVRKRYALGRGRVLMARRFPAYDAQPYTVSTSVRLALREGGSLARGSLRARRLDRAAASRAVASVGRLVASLEMRLRGMPARRLMDTGAAPR